MRRASPASTPPGPSSQNSVAPAAAAHALALADRDAAAYGQLNALWKLPKDAPERAAGWDAAVAEAIEAPQAILEAAREPEKGT